jgi:hypothetical protein
MKKINVTSRIVMALVFECLFLLVLACSSSKEQEKEVNEDEITNAQYA